MAAIESIRMVYQFTLRDSACRPAAQIAVDRAAHDRALMQRCAGLNSFPRLAYAYPELHDEGARVSVKDGSEERFSSLA